MYYKTPIFDNVVINTRTQSVYIQGEKVCESEADYTLFKDYLINMNKNLQYKKNLEQKALLTTNASVYYNAGAYGRSVMLNLDVQIELSIKTENSIQSLCIRINDTKYYVSKIDLDTFILQLQKLDGDKKGKHSFKKIPEYFEGLDDFLVSIGQMVIMNDRVGTKDEY